MYQLLTLGVFATNFIFALGSPVITSGLAKRADESFNLFVYGQGLGGQQIMYKDGSAYAIGPETDATALGYTNVTFSFTSTTSRQMAITPVDNDVTFNSTLLFGFSNASSISSVNGTTASSNAAPLGFASESASDFTSTGWLFYGNTLLFVSDDNGLESRFFVSNSSITAGDSTVAVKWLPDGNSQTSDDLPITIRKIKPSNPK